MLAPTYNKGLTSVKTILEAKAALPKTYAGYIIEETSLPAMRYLAIADSIHMDSIMSFHKKNFPLLRTELEKAKIVPTGNPTGVYFTWDMANKTTKLAAAIPIDILADIKKIKKAEEWLSDSSKTLKITYTGPYSKMGDAHKGFYEYIAEHKLTMSVVIEEYVKNPMTEPDTNKWVTNIYYLVK